MAEPSQPESLAQTQARLAGTPDAFALPPGRVAPDPYAGHTLPEPQRRSRPLLLVALAAVGVAGIGGVAAFLAFSGPSGQVDRDLWQTYPAIAGSDTDTLIEQPPLEAVELSAELLLTEYRTELTNALGLEWTQVRDPFSAPQANGYGGESMLWSYSSAAWEGSVTIDDPAARQTVLDIFTDISDRYDLDELAVRNDLFPGDPRAEREFGAAIRPDQALWSFTSWGDDDVANVTLSSEVIDLNVPRGAAFDGDFGFGYVIEGNTLYVTVEAFAPLLLRTADITTFVDRLAEFDGIQPPQ